MEIARIDAENPSQEILEEAAACIVGGKVVVCPTDTGYAFSANGLDELAVGRVFKLKGRDFANPMHVAVENITAAEKYAEISGLAHQLAERYLPGALTMVFNKKAIVPSCLVAGKSTLGIRVPASEFILRLCRLTCLPITTTSANLSSLSTPFSAEEALKSLKPSEADVPLVVDGGEISPREVSTIIDMTVTPP
ncbi:L-threonylcarbamoyladenylate synthase, partial [Chloroflexota bacterium]